MEQWECAKGKHDVLREVENFERLVATCALLEFSMLLTVPVKGSDSLGRWFDYCDE